MACQPPSAFQYPHLEAGIYHPTAEPIRPGLLNDNSRSLEDYLHALEEYVECVAASSGGGGSTTEFWVIVKLFENAFGVYQQFGYSRLLTPNDSIYALGGPGAAQASGFTMIAEPQFFFAGSQISAQIFTPTFSAGSFTVTLNLTVNDSTGSFGGGTANNANTFFGTGPVTTSHAIITPTWGPGSATGAALTQSPSGIQIVTGGLYFIELDIALDDTGTGLVP